MSIHPQPGLMGETCAFNGKGGDTCSGYDPCTWNRKHLGGCEIQRGNDSSAANADRFVVVSIGRDDLIHLCISWCCNTWTGHPTVSKWVERKVYAVRWAEHFDRRDRPLYDRQTSNFRSSQKSSRLRREGSEKPVSYKMGPIVLTSH